MTSPAAQVLINDQPNVVVHEFGHLRVNNTHVRPYVRPKPLVVLRVTLNRLVEHGLREIEHFVSGATPWDWRKLAETLLEDHSHRS